MLKKKPGPSGAPEWVLTYGDMMSLLLCFFILLAAFADYEAGGEDDAVATAIQSIREAFGMTGQIGKLADPSIDFHSLIQKLESVIKAIEPRDRGDAPEEGIYDRNFRLRRIRDGLEITIGGPVLFDPFSAKVTDEGKRSLEQIGDMLKGHRNMVEIRGHAAEEPRPADWTYDDAMALSFERAKAVQNELILRGVDPRTLRLVVVGSNEPVAQGVYDPAKRGNNRRVEIIVRESLIDDYIGQTPTDASSAVAPSESPESVASR